MKKWEKMQMKARVKRLLWPETCPFCGRVYAGGICPKCLQLTERLLVREPRCMKCGKPVRYKEQEFCSDCVRMKHSFDRGAGLWLHKNPVNQSIYQFKYHNQRFCAEYFAEQLVRQYQETIRGWAPEVILPVPLHTRKRRSRGYNQAELLADELGRRLGIPVCKDLVRRVKFTSPQKILDSRKRKKNLERAFALSAPVRNLRRVLVTDDIYTTGSTIDAVAKILKSAGIQKVYFLTVSIGQGD